MSNAIVRTGNESRYLATPGDRLDAGKDESILGHFIEEKGWDLEKTLHNLKPNARIAYDHTETSNRYSKWFAVGCAIAGILGGGTLGAVGLLPLGTATAALIMWNQARECLPRRKLELQCLKSFPELPNLAWHAHQNGATERQIISAWDSLLDEFEGSSGATGEQIEAEFKRLLATAAFQGHYSTPGERSESDADDSEVPTSVAIPVPAIPVMESPSVQPETYNMAAKEVSKDDRQALIARLNQDCPALVKLIKSHPIRLTGTQRSGKSTIAKILGLLRMVLLPGHGVVAATPHYEPANPYPKVFTVAGVTAQGKRDYPAIERQWFGMAGLVESCQQSNISYIWDEFGLFDQAIPDSDGDTDKIKRVLTSCLRETMKFGIYPMFIVHGETAAFLPGSKGLVTVFLNSTVRVEAIGEQVQDDMGLPTLRPTGRFNVTYLDGSKDEGKLPDWLTEEYLLGLIGNQQPPKVETPEVNFERTKTEPNPTPHKSRIRIPSRGKTISIPSYNQLPVDEKAPEIDTAIELINEDNNLSRREAMTIAYKWSKNRADSGKVITKSDFLDRARKDRNSAYLRDNSGDIWEDLQALIN